MNTNNRNSSTTSINPNHIAQEIERKYPLAYLNDKFYLYKNGVYVCKNAENEIASIVKQICGDNFSIHLLREVKASLQASNSITSDQIDCNNNILNLENGLLNLDTFELVNHAPTYYSLRQLPCKYLPEAVFPKWEEFMYEVLGDDLNKMDIIQEFFGYTLTKVTNQEKILWLFGKGGNGKSVVIKVLSGILGWENISAVPLELFKNPNYVAKLANAMVNISSESNNRTQVYESRLKELASGDMLAADHKYGQPFDFANSCKLIFSFNTLPRLEDKTDATYRRLIIIPFNKSFPEHMQNKNLANELLEEKSGILNWALSGLQRLHAQGKFTDCISANCLIQDYRKDNNHIVSFVDELCVLDSEASLEKGTLYVKYVEYCKVNTFRPYSSVSFGRELKSYFKQLGERNGTNNVAFWDGIKLK